MRSDISIIIVLYKTDLKRIKYLNNLKKHKLLVFDQDVKIKQKNKIKTILSFDFEYLSSNKNIGLSKAMNLLIKKVKTKYCLLVEPDIEINNKSVNLLRTYITKKDCLFVGPNLTKKIFKKPISYTKKFDFSCLLFDVKKVKKFKFYDEDFSFYWEDIDLLTRVNNSKYKMITVNKAYATHDKSKSSINSFNVQIIKGLNFKYGELVFDYKYKKLSKIKVIRHLYLCPLRVILYILLLNKKKTIINFCYFLGTLKFLNYLFNKK